MAAAVISTLIFASPGASAWQAGGRTDSDVGQTDVQAMAAKAPASNRLGTPTRDGAAFAARSLHVSDPSADPCSTFERCNYLAGRRLKLMGKDERRIVALLVRIHKLRGGGRSDRLPPVPASGGVRGVICSVFGAHCSEAIHVATCESHLNVYARNPNPPAGDRGDYLGLFQFGDYARARFGFGWDALTQARAAYRYFLDAGWSPWECRP